MVCTIGNNHKSSVWGVYTVHVVRSKPGSTRLQVASITSVTVLAFGPRFNVSAS